jgi:protein transport protein SEC24
VCVFLFVHDTNWCCCLIVVPPDYYCVVGMDGKRYDHKERPELNHGVIEFIAPQEYMVRPPQPPVYFFVIEVTYAAVASGMLQATVNAIKRAMPSLTSDPRTQIGFLGFDHQLYFFNLRSTLSQPQILVVPDVSAYTEGYVLRATAGCKLGCAHCNERNN